MRTFRQRGPIKVTSNTLYRDLVGEGVLLQLDVGEYFSVEGVAHRAWQLLTSTPDLERVFDTLAAEYDVSPDELAIDLERFVDDLAGNRLIEFIGPPEPG